jgi:hypothetical protein
LPASNWRKEWWWPESLCINCKKYFPFKLHIFSVDLIYPIWGISISQVLTFGLQEWLINRWVM